MLFCSKRFTNFIAQVGFTCTKLKKDRNERYLIIGNLHLTDNILFFEQKTTIDSIKNTKGFILPHFMQYRIPTVSCNLLDSFC